jgi:tRNA/tmRNA/rRNA uracil-C5-methylase (TrmA/RlmC/RlmD family)
MANLHADGIINLQIAETLAKGTGRIHGVDSSAAMITASKKSVAAADASIQNVCTFEGR